MTLPLTLSPFLPLILSYSTLLATVTFVVHISNEILWWDSSKLHWSRSSHQLGGIRLPSHCTWGSCSWRCNCQCIYQLKLSCLWLASSNSQSMPTLYLPLTRFLLVKSSTRTCPSKSSILPTSALMKKPLSTVSLREIHSDKNRSSSLEILDGKFSTQIQLATVSMKKFSSVGAMHHGEDHQRKYKYAGYAYYKYDLGQSITLYLAFLVNSILVCTRRYDTCSSNHNH